MKLYKTLAVIVYFALFGVMTWMIWMALGG
jgi:hypothetical protein